MSNEIDFAALAKAVDAKLKIGGSDRGGRPRYPTELMIRLLMIQQLYNLSDDALEYQVLDRASFLRFTGLEKSSCIPDAKTVWVWRERLNQQNLIGNISAAVGRQWAQAGYVAPDGQIIDASIITAPVQHNRSAENEAIKRGEKPEGLSAVAGVAMDDSMNALALTAWHRFDRRAHFGYVSSMHGSRPCVIRSTKRRARCSAGAPPRSADVAATPIARLACSCGLKSAGSVSSCSPSRPKLAGKSLIHRPACVSAAKMASFIFGFCKDGL